MLAPIRVILRYHVTAFCLPEAENRISDLRPLVVAVNIRCTHACKHPGVHNCRWTTFAHTSQKGSLCQPISRQGAWGKVGETKGAGRKSLDRTRPWGPEGKGRQRCPWPQLVPDRGSPCGSSELFSVHYHNHTVLFTFPSGRAGSLGDGAHTYVTAQSLRLSHAATRSFACSQALSTWSDSL